MPNSYHLPLTWNGITLSVNEWAARIGMNPGTLYGRIKAGWDADRALNTPVLPQHPHWYDAMRARGAKVCSPINAGEAASEVDSAATDTDVERPAIELELE